jgi:hypothetical protein
LRSLDDALTGAPESAFERGMQEHARKFAAAIKAGPKAETSFIEQQP